MDVVQCVQLAEVTRYHVDTRLGREKVQPLEAAWVARTPGRAQIIAAYRAALANPPAGGT